MIRTTAVNIKKITSVFLCLVMIVLVMPHIATVNVCAETDAKGSRIIVSLGDSFSSGEGIEEFYGQNDSAEDKVENQDWLAHRSINSWSGQLTLEGVDGPMSKHRNENWYFVASSGAETVHLKDKKQYKAYNYNGLTGSNYIDKQLDIFKELDKKGEKAEYVTVSIGGNDANFAEVVTEAAMPHPLNPGALNDLLKSTWNEFYYGVDGGTSIRDRLFKAYEDIQEAAGTQAKIIVAGYPKLLAPEGSDKLFSTTDAHLINDSVSRFNDEIESIVKSCKASGMKICFVSVEEDFGANGAYSSNPYIHKVELAIFARGLTEDLVDFGKSYTDENGDSKRAFASSYSMHPNEKGAKIYAECVQKKIEEIEKDNGKAEWPLLSSSDEREIALVLDVSGSMSGTPMEETQKASQKFINTILKEDASLGIVTYDSDSMCIADFCMNENYLNDAIQNINSGGGTDMEAGLSQAYSMLQQSDAKKKIIVLMSDGAPNEGKVGDELIAYADTIKDQGIYIYTLGFFESMGSSKSSAQILMEEIASDGCHYEVADADNLVFFFGDIADQINGQKYIYVRIACPVDVTVKYDGETLCSVEEKLNTRTAFGSLTFEDNEEEAESGSDNRIKVLRLKEGTDYDIQIEGNGRGYMDYTIGFMDDTGEYSDLRKFNNIKITKRTVIDTVAASSNSTVLNVDEDGDGKYDLKYKATENGRGEIVDYTYIVYIVIGVAALILILIVAIKIKSILKRKGPKEPKKPKKHKLKGGSNMSKFCGNCGTKMDDTANVCGNCGTPLNANNAVNVSIPGISYVDPEKSAKMKKKVKLVAILAVIVVVAIIAINIVSGFVGYKGAVRKIMNAYTDYNVDAIVSMASEFYYVAGSDNYVEDYFDEAVSGDFDIFENQVGHNYKLSYEITDSYTMSDYKYKELIDTLSYYDDFDVDMISKVMVVEVKVTAKEGRNSTTVDVALTLTKEDGSWKLLYMR